jgi:hypothetical protein
LGPTHQAVSHPLSSSRIVTLALVSGTRNSNRYTGRLTVLWRPYASWADEGNQASAVWVAGDPRSTKIINLLKGKRRLSALPPWSRVLERVRSGTRKKKYINSLLPPPPSKINSPATHFSFFPLLFNSLHANY